PTRVGTGIGREGRIDRREIAGDDAGVRDPDDLPILRGERDVVLAVAVDVADDHRGRVVGSCELERPGGRHGRYRIGVVAELQALVVPRVEVVEGAAAQHRHTLPELRDLAGGRPTGLAGRAAGVVSDVRAGVHHLRVRVELPERVPERRTGEPIDVTPD